MQYPSTIVHYFNKAAPVTFENILVFKHGHGLYVPQANCSEFGATPLPLLPFGILPLHRLAH
jgi:hypothetical protein